MAVVVVWDPKLKVPMPREAPMRLMLVLPERLP